MEKVLDVYRRPYDPALPVICMDETPRPTHRKYGRLEQEVSAWQSRRDHLHAKVNWQFTTANARVKLKRLYPSFDA